MDKDPKLRPLYLAQILYERTDEDHYLTTAELMEILEKEHGFKVHRQTIPADVAALRSFGMEIQEVMSSQKRYNLISREYDIAEIKLLIDAVEELEPGKRAVARKCVSYNEPYFGGHFPGEPVMPGVLIVEALAQTGAVAILSMEENRGKTAYFAEINRARFKKKVVPGDVLTLTTEIIRQKGPIGIGSATASVRGEVVCTAELTFAIGSKEE